MGINVEDSRKDVYETVITIILIFLFLTIGTLALLAGRGIEKQENLAIYTFYGVLSIIVGLALMSLKIGHYFISKNPKDYKKYGWIGCVVWDYEDSLMSKVPILNNWFSKFSNQTLFGWIAFGIIGIMSTVTNTFLNALVFVPQQVTKIGEGILSLEPVNSGETGLISLILGLEFSTLLWLKHKYNWNNATFYAIVFFTLIPTSIVVWVLLHSFVYANSDTDLIAVGFFGFLWAFFLIMFGNIFLLWQLHFTNLIFKFLNETVDGVQLISDDSIIILSVAILILYTVLHFLFKGIAKSVSKSGSVS